MIPAITGIDHVHVYVTNWADAEEWYGKVLGYERERIRRLETAS